MVTHTRERLIKFGVSNCYREIGVFTILVLAMLIVGCTPVEESKSSRWYSQAQVEEGTLIFRKNCETCHGENARSTPDWKTADDNGNYPAPPLDGSAHTWHHDLSILRKTINDGGVALGGTMPPFKDKLGIEQQNAVIAYFQDIWSDEIYAKWSERFLKKDSVQRSGGTRNET